MLCTLLLNISYLVNECQTLPGHILLFKDKNTSLHNILAHFTHHAGNGSVWQHTLKEDGNFHRYWHPNTGKEHETFPDTFLHFLKGGISWPVWFTLRLPCCPVERTGWALSLQHWFPQKGSVAGAKSAVIPAVGLWGYEKASPISTCEMGVVRTE